MAVGAGAENPQKAGRRENRELVSVGEKETEEEKESSRSLGSPSPRLDGWSRSNGRQLLTGEEMTWSPREVNGLLNPHNVFLSPVTFSAL